MRLLDTNRNFQYHQKQKLIVIWQGKSACTIVNKMYYEQEGLLKEALEYSHWIHNYRGKHNIETDSIRKNSLLDTNTKYIQFVVNPYRRIVSSYIHAMITNYIKLDNNNISFNEFITMLINQKLTSDLHHNLQLFYLNSEKKIEYIKMENINELLPIINKKYGINYSIKTSDHHAKTSDSVNEFIGNTLWKDLKGIPKNYLNFYNNEIKEKIEKLYGEDIKTFNYTWDEFVASNNN